MPEWTRRQIVRALTAGAATAPGLSRAAFAPDRREDRFSFLLLGDTHFDRPTHHDYEWLRVHYPKDLSQIENYCRLTREALPKLLAAAAERTRAADPPVAFALHVGDLVEGLCGNLGLATRHCTEAWEFFRRADLGVPLLMTKGNHDVTGPGAAEAFRDVLLAATAAELGRDRLERACYSFERGGHLFAALDAYDRTAVDWLETLVRERTFRRLFVLVHPPVVPYNARATWHLLSHPRQAETRRRLIDLLGRHRAIVLCGHLHKYSLLVRRCPTGRFVQLAVSSVMKGSGKARPPLLTGPDDYGPDLTDLEPSFSPDTLDLRRANLAAEAPFIEHFEYADAAGFALLSVEGDEVRADVRDGSDSAEPWRKHSLSALLV